MVPVSEESSQADGLQAVLLPHQTLDMYYVTFKGL